MVITNVLINVINNIMLVIHQQVNILNANKVVMAVFYKLMVKTSVILVYQITNVN